MRTNCIRPGGGEISTRGRGRGARGGRESVHLGGRPPLYARLVVAPCGILERCVRRPFRAWLHAVAPLNPRTRRRLSLLPPSYHIPYRRWPSHLWRLPARERCGMGASRHLALGSPLQSRRCSSRRAAGRGSAWPRARERRCGMVREDITTTRRHQSLPSAPRGFSRRTPEPARPPPTGSASSSLAVADARGKGPPR